MKLREIILNKLAGFNIYELREANEKYILHLQGQIDEQNVTIQTLRNEVKTQKNEVRRLTSKIDETDNIFKYWSAKVDATASLNALITPIVSSFTPFALHCYHLQPYFQ